LKSHITAIVDELKDETISHIVVTHTHSDHSPAANPLQELCGAVIYGSSLSRNDFHDDVGESMEEDVDDRFRATIEISDGDVLTGDNWTLQCIHTPGHMSNHFCYRLLEEKALFTGDHVMGWSTTVIIPPDGSMSDYMKSLDLLLRSDDKIYYPTHGPPIEDPVPFVRAYKAHRLDRERQIVECLRKELSTVDEMVAVVYRDTDLSLHKAAARSLFANLIKLWDEGRIICSTAKPTLSSKYIYKPTEKEF